MRGINLSIWLNMLHDAFTLGLPRSGMAGLVIHLYPTPWDDPASESILDKSERVYLHAYDTVSQARASIMDYVNWYNKFRPNSSLKKRTPDGVYNVMLPTVKLAV